MTRFERVARQPGLKYGAAALFWFVAASSWLVLPRLGASMAEAAQVLVTHLRAAIARVVVGGRAVEAAIGAACAPDAGCTARDLLVAADAALREDKPTGRRGRRFVQMS